MNTQHNDKGPFTKDHAVASDDLNFKKDHKPVVIEDTEDGSHPVATGLGAVAAGALATAAGTLVAGPLGGVLGAVVGSSAGGLAGHSLGERAEQKEREEELSDAGIDAVVVKKDYLEEPYARAEVVRTQDSFQGSDRIENSTHPASTAASPAFNSSLEATTPRAQPIATSPVDNPSQHINPDDRSLRSLAEPELGTDGLSADDRYRDRDIDR